MKGRNPSIKNDATKLHDYVAEIKNEEKIMCKKRLLTTVVFRCLAFSQKDSIYAEALLSQTGEFGLLACSLAYQLQIIDHNFFKSASPSPVFRFYYLPDGNATKTDPW